MRRIFIVDHSFVSVGGHYFAYSTAVAEGALAVDLSPTILANQRLGQLPRGAVNEAIQVVPWFPFTWHEGWHIAYDKYEIGHFGFDLLNGLDAYGAEAEDLVLVHTLGWHQVLQLLSLLGDIPVWRAKKLPRMSIILRYEPRLIDLYYQGKIAEQLETVRRHLNLADRIKFYTDTDRLTEFCTDFFGHPFSTAPIPFPQKLLVAALDRRVSDPDPDRTLCVAYVGDARDEKGYPLLPSAVARLWRNLISRKVKFVIQSNFNTPDGDRATAAARQQLQVLPPVGLKLIFESQEGEDYFETIANADIVLVPYDPVTYEARSSGILVEALTAGKVVVTPRGSWMETQVDSSHAVVYQTAEEFPAAVEHAVEHFQSLDTGAKRAQARWLRQTDPAFFIRFLVEDADATPSSPEPTGPSILLIMHGDAIIARNGASRVVRNQVDHLFRAGYQVTGVFVSGDPDRSGPDCYAYRQRLERELGELPFEDLHILFYMPGANPGSEFPFHRFRADRQSGAYSLRRDIDYIRNLQIPSSLSAALRKSLPDAILMNYVTHLPLIEMLGLTGVPILCETIDFQSVQKAIYGRRAVSDEDFDLELSMLSRCDALTAISERDERQMRECLPQKEIVEIPVLSAPLPGDEMFLFGARDIAELFQFCDKSHHPVAERIKNWKKVDLLFVSSSHLANVSGLQWFFDKVWTPYLADSGLTLVVAGTICDFGGWPTHENVAYLGRVEYLEPLYVAARSVILPIIEGAGSAVKTMEALAWKKPIIATTCALRGLGKEAALFTTYDSPDRFANAIMELSNDEGVRAAAVQKSIQAADAFSSDEYDRRYYRLLNGLIGDRARPAIPRQELANTIEWTDDRAWFNRAAISAVVCESVDLEAFGEIAWRIAADEEGVRRAMEATVAHLKGPQSPLGTSLARLMARRSGTEWSDIVALARSAHRVGQWFGNGGKIRSELGRIGLLEGVGVHTPLVLRGERRQIVEFKISGDGDVSGVPFHVTWRDQELPLIGLRNVGIWKIACFEIPRWSKPGLMVGELTVTASSNAIVIEDVRVVQRLAPGGADPGSGCDPLVLGERWHGVVRDHEGAYRWTVAGMDANATLPRLTGADLVLRLELRRGTSENILADLDMLLEGQPMRLIGNRIADQVIFSEFVQDGPDEAPYPWQAHGQNLCIRVPHPGFGDRGVAVVAVEISESLLSVMHLNEVDLNGVVGDESPQIEGYVDAVDSAGYLCGWVRSATLPRLKLTVGLRYRDRIMSRVKADIFRGDLLAAGKGDGVAGFQIKLDGIDVEKKGMEIFIVETGKSYSALPLTEIS